MKYYPLGHRGIFSRSRPPTTVSRGQPRTTLTTPTPIPWSASCWKKSKPIENLGELVAVDGVDVYFIGSGDLSQSMGYPGQQTHPEVQEQMEKGVKIIRDAGRIAGCSCPDSLVPKFLDLGVQYFHSNVGTLLQTSSVPYLKSMRESATAAGL